MSNFSVLINKVNINNTRRWLVPSSIFPVHEGHRNLCSRQVGPEHPTDLQVAMKFNIMLLAVVLQAVETKGPNSYMGATEDGRWNEAMKEGNKAMKINDEIARRPKNARRSNCIYKVTCKSNFNW